MSFFPFCHSHVGIHLLTKDLIDDEDIVRAAIAQGGLELQYASLRLQEDPEIVRLACESDGRALGYCPEGPTRNSLTSDRAFMMEVVLAKPGSGRMWNLAPSDLKRDPELLLQALTNGLNLRDIPLSFKHDLGFLRRALRVSSHLYLQLVPILQKKLSLAREAILSADSTPEIHEKVLLHCPSLKSERQVVLCLCLRGDVEFLHLLLSSPDSNPFTDDLEIMIAAVKRDPSLLEYASLRLRFTPELILVSITPASAFNTLKTVPAAIMRENLDIPTRAVDICTSGNLRYLPVHIPDDIWMSHRPLCRAWLKRGGRVLESFEPLLAVQPPFTQADIELPLAVALYNWREMHKVGEALLGDRDFMLQALGQDGRVLRFAAPALRQELDMQIIAVANYNKNIAPGTNATVQQYLGGTIDIPGLRQHIDEKMQLQHIFCQFFLRGIAIARPHRPPHLRSQLPMLDRGIETSEAFKRLIAEYLGVPLGRGLALLRRAHVNLETAPLSSSESEVAGSSSPAAAAEGLAQGDTHWLQRDAYVPAPPNVVRPQGDHPAQRIRNRLPRGRQMDQERRLRDEYIRNGRDRVVMFFDDDDELDLDLRAMEVDVPDLGPEEAESVMNAFDDEGF
jgi:Domain of unknown function (DUF4116)